MHWKFGMLNVGTSDQDILNQLPQKCKQYIHDFKSCSTYCRVRLNPFVLKMCIAVSCSDIRATTNRGLSIPWPPLVYPAYYSWTKRYMNRPLEGRQKPRYLLFRDKLVYTYKIITCRRVKSGPRKGRCYKTRSRRKRTSEVSSCKERSSKRSLL